MITVALNSKNKQPNWSNTVGNSYVSGQTGRFWSIGEAILAGITQVEIIGGTFENFDIDFTSSSNISIRGTKEHKHFFSHAKLIFAANRVDFWGVHFEEQELGASSFFLSTPATANFEFQYSTIKLSTAQLYLGASEYKNFKNCEVYLANCNGSSVVIPGNFESSRIIGGGTSCSFALSNAKKVVFSGVFSSTVPNTIVIGSPNAVWEDVRNEATGIAVIRTDQPHVRFSNCVFNNAKIRTLGGIYNYTFENCTGLKFYSLCNGNFKIIGGEVAEINTAVTGTIELHAATLTTYVAGTIKMFGGVVVPAITVPSNCVFEKVEMAAVTLQGTSITLSGCNATAIANNGSKNTIRGNKATSIVMASNLNSCIIDENRTVNVISAVNPESNTYGINYLQ